MISIKRDLFTNDLEVVLQIFDTSNKRGEDVSFSKLVKILNGRISRNRTSQALDRLFDDGILAADFRKVNGKWARVYQITGEAEGLLDNIFTRVVKE